ncbi:MAG: phage terminase small subunit [Pseudomonadota bacterium]
MSRPITPARANFERKMAAARAAETPAAVRGDATAYELMLAKLAEDRRRLHEIQSIERKIELKRTLLPDYAPWITGVLAGNHGVQDDVLMTVMVWRIDTGDLEGALAIAAYAIEHQLAMPDQYKRSTGCLIAEEFAGHALKLEVIDAATTKQLLLAERLVAEQDMPDEVRAKLLKAIGYGLNRSDDIEQKRAAIDYLKRALALHDGVGVKKNIEAIEREIKKLTDSGAGNPPGA